MIDIENELYTHMSQYLKSSVTFSPEFVRKPAKFPFVSMYVMDNTLYSPDSGETEKFCKILVQFDIYSNKTSGRKQECKDIAKLIDVAQATLGFSRISLSPTPNIDDATIYRITSRYTGIVDTTKTIYRR